jgi:phosphoribosylanthranilate isomerase
MKPRIKICCISSREEAAMAMDFGAAALGLVGKMPSGPGIISDQLIYDIARFVPPPVGTFLLTSETTAEEILSHHYKTNTNTVQLVDELKAGTYLEIRKQIPSVKIVQVIHVRSEASIEEALALSEHVDALLLDSGNPTLDIKVLGGTGNTHDWSLSRKIVEQSKIPVFLAGGLHAGNVQEALEKVQPFGLDLCSGVRTNKQLDPVKLEAFFKAALY